MQCNVLQWQAFHMYQYFFIDHGSPSQRTQGKSTTHATCLHQTQEGAAACWSRPGDTSTPCCGWREAAAPASCPSKHPGALLAHRHIRTGACKGPHFAPTPAIQASLEPPDSGSQRWLQLSAWLHWRQRAAVVSSTRSGWDPVQLILQGPQSCLVLDFYI